MAAFISIYSFSKAESIFASHYYIFYLKKKKKIIKILLKMHRSKRFV